MHNYIINQLIDESAIGRFYLLLTGFIVEIALQNKFVNKIFFQSSLKFKMNYYFYTCLRV